MHESNIKGSYIPPPENNDDTVCLCQLPRTPDLLVSDIIMVSILNGHDSNYSRNFV